MLLSNKLNASLRRLSNFALRVQHEAILNRGAPTSYEGDIAAQLMRASKAVLAEAVDPGSGLIDYASLKQSDTYQDFRDLALSLKHFPVDKLGEGPAYLAFWINIYNALIIDAIIQYEIRGSMMRKPGVFLEAAYMIDGSRFSADDIEHGILRRNRPNPVLPIRPFTSNDPRARYMVKQFDPRIHFALVCGARSCPPIAYYSPERLAIQLDQAAGGFINGDSVKWDSQGNTLWLSKIFAWYLDDFGGKQGTLDFIKGHTRDEEIRALPAAADLNLRYLPYDWSINQSVGT